MVKYCDLILMSTPSWKRQNKWIRTAFPARGARKDTTFIGFNSLPS